VPLPSGSIASRLLRICPLCKAKVVGRVGQINLNIELIFSEFVEGLVRSADLIHREKVSDVAERVERLLQHLEKQAKA
jgi:hypothetical protein